MTKDQVQIFDIGINELLTQLQEQNSLGTGGRRQQVREMIKTALDPNKHSEFWKQVDALVDDARERNGRQ